MIGFPNIIYDFDHCLLSKNPDENIHLNFGDQFLKIHKNHSGKASALNSDIFQKNRAKYASEKIYLDFGDQNFKIDQKSFSPGSRPPKRNFPQKSVKKILKN